MDEPRTVYYKASDETWGVSDKAIAEPEAVYNKTIVEAKPENVVYNKGSCIRC